MQQRDSEFLIWIAKRLVYKYKENPDIISVIENIIHKYDLEKSIYQDMFFNVHTDLESIISNLVSTNQLLFDKFNGSKNKSELIKTNSIFENLDVEQLFK